MKKFKIIILMPCWRRSGVLKLVTKQMDEFCKFNKEKVDITILYIVSPEDVEYNEIVECIEGVEHDKIVVKAPNNRLGQKLNIGIEKANEVGYDYLMNIGSDDLLGNGLIDVYMPFMEKDIDLFGLTSLYIYNKNSETLFFKYYNHPYIIGGGRMIKKSVIEETIKKHGYVYPPEIRRSMDGNSANLMATAGFKQTLIDTKEAVLLVDIKTDVNITSFSLISRIGAVKKYITPVKKELVESVFPILKEVIKLRSNEN